MSRYEFFRLSLMVTIASIFVVNTALAQTDDVPRFEIAAQFSILKRHKPTPLLNAPTVTSDDFFSETIAGFGGRFTYNLTDNIALEAETNFFPDSDEGLDPSGPGGHILQGQFGVKAGKRFKRFGVFGKLRPGFVRFGEVVQLTGTQIVFAGNQQFPVGTFRVGADTYFSTDVGGVIEYYPSRRWVVRFDLGDTIIRYGTYRRDSLVLSIPFLERPGETKHSFQFSSGVGFRF